MKEYNEIDQLFEEQLGGLSVEPSASSWDNISAGLDAGAAVSISTSNNRRYYILALIGSLAALLVYFFLYNQGEITPGSNNLDSISEIKGLESKTINNKSNDPITVKPITNSDQPSNIVNSSYTLSEPSISTENTVIESKSEPFSTSKPESLTNKHIAERDNYGELNSGQEVGQSNSHGNHSTASTIKPVTTKESSYSAVNETIAIANISSENNANTSEIISSKTEIAEVNPSSEEIIEVTEIEEQQTERSSTKESEIEPTTAAPEKLNTDSETTPNVAPIPSTTAGIRFATGWSIDAVAGPMFSKTNEKVTPSEGSQIYLSDIDNYIVTPNIDINIKYHINNWFIQSGLGYAEYGENRNFVNEKELHDTTGYSNQVIEEYYSYDSVGFFIDPNQTGVPITLYDAILHADTSYNWVPGDSIYYEKMNIYAKNRYRYIEIPVMVGYEFRFKNLGLQLSTGLSVGFRVNSSGMFFDSQNNLVDINSGNSPYSNTTINYIFTAGVKYHLTNQLSVLAQPVYKTNINGLLKSGAGPSYNNFGINLGVNYIIK